MKKHILKYCINTVIILLLLYVVLLIPDSTPDIPVSTDAAAFAWNMDDYWNQLEEKFISTKETGCDTVNKTVSSKLRQLNAFVTEFESDSSTTDYEQFQKTVFETAPTIAACSDSIKTFLTIIDRFDASFKNKSRTFDLNDPNIRDLLYRILYGNRLCVEEIILQADSNSIDPMLRKYNEPSITPSAEILGCTVHSGDIFVSRGGAPTSALISRGNDYPGNFSHIALIHIDENTHKVSVIESHIEIGVAVSSLEKYFKDTKLRIMILRPRADLPQLQADPMLPHKAATLALQRATEHHIPYDFEMDFTDNSKLFCSEVASSVYHDLCLDLWMKVSRMSTPGIRSWLAAFGVKHFETQAPSDLEYDPQLRVIGEWRDPDLLFKDHIDNAILDAMLERAEAGEPLKYDWYMLPIGRVMKAYSWILNQFDKAGPIPEGMSASSALINHRFSRWHENAKQRLLVDIKDFQIENGYPPPYWDLVDMARNSLGDQ